ncbi:MAG: glutaredoxin family protein [Vibrio sp.]
MKRVVLYVADKCPHCKAAKMYLDSKGIQYRLCNAKMQRGRKELEAIGARGVPVLKIGDRMMAGWNAANFDKIYNAK